jgi:Domain of unknown function (DUF4062)
MDIDDRSPDYKSMIKRRFQVFVSSTFEDLREERQAAVEAILKAGHIPAGMELFSAGSESQLEVIRQWIRDSDIYMLILGGRYGSIEPKSGFSYTEVEFNYARELGKPFFSVVLSDEGREAKVKIHGTAVLERTNLSKYDAFRVLVRSHMCASFESAKDIKLAVFETLPQLTSIPDLAGWIPASEAGPGSGVIDELARALQDNRSMKTEIEQLRSKVSSYLEKAPSFEELYRLLSAEKVTVPADLIGSGVEEKVPLLEVAVFYARPSRARGHEPSRYNRAE